MSSIRGIEIGSSGRLRQPAHAAAGRLGERAQLFRRRNDFLEFERIVGADVDQRDMLAVAGAIEAVLIDDEVARERPGSAGAS